MGYDFESKIAEWLNKIGIDYVLHFLVVAWVTSVGFGKSFTYGVWFFLAIFVLGIVKEKVIDKKFDWLDVIAGFFGGWASFALYWILTEVI